MAIPEPSTPLWLAVKAVYDAWPLDLEDTATALAAAWRQGITAMNTGATDTAAAAGSAHAAWQDDAGGAFTTTVAEQTRTMAELGSQMAVAAARGDAYATQLTGAKTDIVTTIAANEGLYAFLGSPLLGAAGPVLRQNLVTAIAAELRTMIESRAAALRSGTATAVPRPEPPPQAGPAAPPADDGGNFWSGLGHLALDAVGLVPVFGEAADVINAGWYALEGDYVNAGLSLAAAIPVAGWVTTGGKLGYKAVTNLDAAKNWLKDKPAEVPWTAVTKPYNGPPHISTGLRHEWTDPATGKTVRYHAHGPDSTAAPGSNAHDGPTYRQRVGKQYLDTSGNTHDATGKAYNEKYLQKNDAAANATHIPFDSANFSEPHLKRVRVQPNLAAWAPVEQPGGEESR